MVGVVAGLTSSARGSFTAGLPLTGDGLRVQAREGRFLDFRTRSLAQYACESDQPRPEKQQRGRLRRRSFGFGESLSVEEDNILKLIAGDSNCERIGSGKAHGIAGDSEIAEETKGNLSQPHVAEVVADAARRG